jgi:2-keto-4-pentenoate hydratase/2-oxohepta-3-ene-1,7-dioic acid hydratase in catechol pathway
MTTGTPGGVGYGRNPKVFMQPGDVISITVDGVGELTNPIVAARAF